jgi:hypothetical protein
VCASKTLHDDELYAARCVLARALLDHMRLLGEGTLAFSAPTGFPDSERHELLDLAGTLTAQLAGAPLSVAIRFDDARPKAPSGREDQSRLSVA